jgi:sortase A
VGSPCPQENTKQKIGSTKENPAMKKGAWSNFILILVLLAGLSLLLYPSFSDYWNSLHQSRAITVYADSVAELDKEDYQHILDEAVAYNRDLLSRENQFSLTNDQRRAYPELLNLAGNGVMGYIEIPSINCALPIYHGVDEAVLQVAIGHLDWTSLPTGGESTHCVLSGHRGLPSAKLFSELDKLREGDLFMLRVLDELFTFEVDKILIVEPDEVDALLIQEGKTLCTLVTCTPYGINTHRMLVRGHRVENPKEALTVRVTADAIQVEPMIIAPIVALPMLILLLPVLLGGRKKR